MRSRSPSPARSRSLGERQPRRSVSRSPPPRRTLSFLSCSLTRPLALSHSSPRALSPLFLRSMLEMQLESKIQRRKANSQQATRRKKRKKESSPTILCLSLLPPLPFVFLFPHHRWKRSTARVNHKDVVCCVRKGINPAVASQGTPNSLVSTNTKAIKQRGEGCVGGRINDQHIGRWGRKRKERERWRRNKRIKPLGWCISRKGKAPERDVVFVCLGFGCCGAAWCWSCVGCVAGCVGETTGAQKRTSKGGTKLGHSAEATSPTRPEGLQDPHRPWLWQVCGPFLQSTKRPCTNPSTTSSLPTLSCMRACNRRSHNGDAAASQGCTQNRR